MTELLLSADEQDEIITLLVENGMDRDAIHIMRLNLLPDVVASLPDRMRPLDQLKSDLAVLVGMARDPRGLSYLSQWLKAGSQRVQNAEAAERLTAFADRVASASPPRTPTEGSPMDASVGQAGVLRVEESISLDLWCLKLNRRRVLITSALLLVLGSTVIWHHERSAEFGSWLDQDRLRGPEDGIRVILTHGRAPERRLAALLLGVTDGLVASEPERWTALASRYQTALVGRAYTSSLDRSAERLVRVVRSVDPDLASWLKVGVEVGVLAGTREDARVEHIEIPQGGPPCISQARCDSQGSCYAMMLQADQCLVEIVRQEAVPIDRR